MLCETIDIRDFIDEKHPAELRTHLKKEPLYTVFGTLHNNNFRPLSLRLIL